jgi:N-acylneuraminate cytidylyltransferase
MKNICFIPLRKGSKGIPNKNTKIFKGKPLFCWSLETIICSEIATEIWIATDCEKVKGIVRSKYPSVHLFERSDINAQDSSPTIDVILEFLLANVYQPQDRILLFQATSPLTSESDILSLKKMLESNEFDSLIACLRMKKFRWSEDGNPLDYTLARKPRRQDYQGFLIETGAFYMSKVGDLLSSKQLLSGKIGIVEVGPHSLIDIDEPIDWSIGQAYAAHLEKYGYE